MFSLVSGARLSALLLMALLINVALFLTMENMISQERVRLVGAFEANTIDFVRTNIDDQTKTKDRRRKPPPKPKDIKRPQARMEPNVAAEAAQLPTTAAMMNITSLLSDGGGVLVGQRLVQGSGSAMMEVLMASELTALSRLPPQYPPSALMREQEGYVELLFDVELDGSVSGAEVIESKPKRIFDRAAVAAVSRWRFQPVVREGVPVQVKARVRLEFTLPKDGG